MDASTHCMGRTQQRKAMVSCYDAVTHGFPWRKLHSIHHTQPTETSK